MKIIVSRHAAERARERCISELLLSEMFRKAIRDAGRGKARQFPDLENVGAIHTLWKGWEFVHAKIQSVNPNGSVTDALLIVTVYSTTSWHSLDGHLTPKREVVGTFTVRP